MERRKFTQEFKLETVRLIKDRRVSYIQALQGLGIHTAQPQGLSVFSTSFSSALVTNPRLSACLTVWRSRSGEAGRAARRR